MKRKSCSPPQRVGEKTSGAKAKRKPRASPRMPRRTSRDLLEKAELEAREIVLAARRERAQLLNELAQERSALGDARARLSGFLADALEEVESPAETSEAPANAFDGGSTLGNRLESSTFDRAGGPAHGAPA